MHYAPRTIACLTEVTHPLSNPDPALIQRVHNQLFQTAEPAYRSFTVTPTGAVLSNPVARTGAVSAVSFLPDRFVFREELSSLTVEDFARRVHTISALVTREVGIQVFTAQQVTVRTLINPRNFKDSRAFLKQGMFGFREETEDFGREPQLYGIRMVFPPSDEQPCAYSLRIESFNSDPRSLFIENHGSFAPILVARGLDSMEQNILDTYGFLVERALHFVGRFDVRAEA